jgi:hypothetical protein
MRQAKAFGLAGVLLLAGSLTVKADVWDVGAENDDVLAETQNQLIHGSDQVHDLAAKGSPAVADLDYFQMRATPFSSYYVSVDGTTGDLDFATHPLVLTLRDEANAVLLQSDQIASGSARSLRFQNGTSDFQHRLVLVSGNQTGCTTTCTANSQYRIRLVDTTIAVPRFNNANGQVTVLMIQNVTNGFIDVTSYFWNAAGTQVHSNPIGMIPHQTAISNLGTFPQLQNVTGTITISHTAGLGGLAVKSVALEPATGFSFDTPGLNRPS